MIQNNVRPMISFQTSKRQPDNVMIFIERLTLLESSPYFVTSTQFSPTARMNIRFFTYFT